MPSFVADAMLGKLARWLRYLGYDTVYLREDDATIAYTARAEDRVLLTRDRGLAQHRGLRTILVASQSLDDQLRQVVDQVGLPPEETRPRCMDCNAPLVSIPRATAKAQVPPYVARTHEVFDQCPECGKIYWRGTHRQGIEELIDRALAHRDAKP
ncbi:MAG: Mut7-C RNAse domain-containing protein [Anaerolineae bacterium]